jgi:MFS family permease
VPPLTALRDRTFRSLRHRNYRLYFLGQIVSFTGSWMQSAALMWLVFDATDDPLWPPLLLVAQVGPTLLLGPFAGALADRRPKRAIVAATQVGFLATAVVLMLLVAANRAAPVAVLAVLAVNGLIQAVDLPTRLAYVPDLVPKPDLINAVSLNSLLFNAARAVGPALAPLFFLVAEAVIRAGWLAGSKPAVVGAIWCIGLNALSYLAVLAALRRIDVPGEPLPPTGRPGSAWDGPRYVYRHRPLARLLLLTGLLCVFAWPALSLFPAYTKFALGRAEKEYSLLVSGLGAGALLGALTTATVGSVERRRRLLAVGAMLAAVGLFGLTLATVLGAAVGSAATLGFGLILFLSTGQSAMQLSVPDGLRGRVMALWAMTLSASAPVGHLLAGGLATAYPVRAVFAGMAAGAAVIAVVVATRTAAGRAN